MRAYSASSEEALHARDLLKDWASEGFFTEAQYQRVEQETVCDLRRTNIFLRIVLFLFTVGILIAAGALFFVVFLPRASVQDTSVTLLVFAAICYVTAELSVSQARLYRYGIEEALAVCAVGLLYGGMESYSMASREMEYLVPAASAAGAIASLWIWRRFGLPYAFLAAVIFLIHVPGYWTTSHTAQHLILAAFYAAGLVAVVVVRAQYRFAYLDQEYSIAEALLWLGIYLAMNLQLSAFILLRELGPAEEFARPFYWFTWVLTWCLPPVVLARGLPRKDRLVMAAGAITAVLTLVTNNPYLGWPRHTWDPMLLGALLIGAAIFIRRWLAKGPGETRQGFTAHRLSGKDKRWMNLGATALGLVSPSVITPSAQPGTSDPQFGGGDSGGAGASSDF
jgi:hypothetical protein